MANSGAAEDAAYTGVPGTADVGLERISAVLAVVESCLCETFPTDFHRRCAFAAFAIRALLWEDGLDPVMIGGQFGAFVITPDQSRRAVQGFEPGPERYPHLWVEAAGRLIDLGPHLLAFGSDYPVVPMPVLAWDLSMPMPAAFRYRTLHRFPADNKISQSKAIQDQCAAFVMRCAERCADPDDVPQLPTWIAFDSASLVAAAGRADAWAMGAKQFEQMAQFQNLPF